MLFFLLSACVDRIEFDAPDATSQLVVEGMITDSPAPYVVKISNASSLSIDSVYQIPVSNIKVKLHDDEGNAEDFIEIEAGTYATSGNITGKIGHAYHITLETTNGKIFESVPDTIHATGQIEEISYEFESRVATVDFGKSQSDVFKIYLNSNAGERSGPGNYVRWRFTGTYKVVTNPELYWYWASGFPLKAPWQCSGYIVVPAGELPPTPPGEGRLEKVDECTCCDCWVNQYEDKPQLSDTELINDNRFNHIKVTEVPINQATFYEKYRVSVEQMSLSKTAFDFFKLMRAQKENANSLFQPPSSGLRGNIFAVNSKESIVGLFWATSISTKAIVIQRSEVPYTLPPIYMVAQPCDGRFYSNSSLTKPVFWE